MMAETDSRVTNLFTKKSHHSDTSVIYIVQNLFSKNRESRTISLNAQYMIVFKNPRDASQLANLARQMYPGRGAFVQEAFTDATASPYGYLLIDLKQNTPDDMRLRTSVLPDDAHQWVYVPKLSALCRKVCIYYQRECRTGYPSGCKIMSDRMKKQAVCLQMLIKTKNEKLRKAILEHADPELIRALSECAHNILRGNVKMTPREKTRLRKYQTKLRLIARKNVSVKQKRRNLQQTGGFLPALLAPLAASVVIPLLRELFA